MKLPKSLIIADSVYSVEITDLPRDLAGDCASDHKIRINKDLSEYEKLVTLVHEAMHAVEFSRNVKVGHRVIEKLEAPIASLIVQLFGYNHSNGPFVAKRRASRVRPNTRGNRKA